MIFMFCARGADGIYSKCGFKPSVRVVILIHAVSGAIEKWRSFNNGGILNAFNFGLKLMYGDGYKSSRR